MLVRIQKPHMSLQQTSKNGKWNFIFNKKHMRRIRRENANIYKSNSGAILHTDTTSPGVISRITTVAEKIQLIVWLKPFS